MKQEIIQAITDLISNESDITKKVELINELRQTIHSVSPMKHHPIDLVLWQPIESVAKNQYNPNSVAPTEMKLLETSISEDGYCVEHTTPILCADLIWRPAGELKLGQEIIAFDEHPLNIEGDRKGRRNYRTAQVTGNFLKKKQLVKVITERGDVLCTPDHPFLVKVNHGDPLNKVIKWVKAEDILPNDIVYKLFEPWEIDQSYEAGWLAGFLDGEGTMAVNTNKRGAKNYRLSGYQRPSPTADKMIKEMTSRVNTSTFVVDRSKSKKNWNNMVMCRVDRLAEIAYLLGSVRPERLIQAGGKFWEGMSIMNPGTAVKVLEVQPHEDGIIASLSTSTKTYIGAGFAMHNTQPVVTWVSETGREIVDGFHRSRIAKESEKVAATLNGFLPVTTVRDSQTDKSNRMASTIRHNRARGTHSVDAMSEIVLELKARNWKTARICKELGMEEDEVLRLCQITGLAGLFSDVEFSLAWESDTASNDSELDFTADFEAITQNTNDKNRIFHTFDKWEAVGAGFFLPGLKNRTKDDCEAEYCSFLGDLTQFEAGIQKVFKEWPNSCEHNLTNSSMNRIAWIGQAAACAARGLPSTFRGGFAMLSEEKQEEANQLALKYLNIWLKDHNMKEVSMAEALSGRDSDLF
jgi:hypothetical protein